METSIKETLLRWLLPEICLHCREDLPGQLRLLCPDCRKNLRPAEAPFCLRCAAPGSSNKIYCSSCIKGESSCRLIRSAFFYRGPVVALVHAFKYQGRRVAARFAGGAMARLLPRYAELAGFDALVPVPLHPRRERERGYNQARLLAEAISEWTGAPILELLTRTRATRPQWSLNRRQRRENIRRVFEAKHSASGKKLLLIDDVCTTGASLEECARVLRQEGAIQVCGYVFARQGLP